MAEEQKLTEHVALSTGDDGYNSIVAVQSSSELAKLSPEENKALEPSSEMAARERAATYQFGKNPYTDNPEWWTQNSMLIGLHIWIYRIRKVDVVNENFLAEVRLALSWEGTKKDFNDYETFLITPNLDQSLFKHLSDNAYDPFNDIVWQNGLISKCEKIDSGVLKVGAIGTNGQKIKETLWDFENFVVYRLECEFFEKFELENFPMDCQDLQITLQLKKRKDVQNFCPNIGVFDFPSGLNASDSNLTEYNVKGFKLEIYDQNYDGQLAVYNFANLRVKIQRKYQVYFSKIIFLMFISSLGSFLVFTMEDDALPDKYGLLVTLLLAAVAVQFVVGTYVPNLPYLTYLDYYVVTSFIIIFFIGLLVSIIQIFKFDPESETIVAVISMVVFFSAQIFFLIWATYARKQENRKLEYDRWDLVEYGYEDKNVQIIGQDQVTMDEYTAEMINKYKWGNQLTELKPKSEKAFKYGFDAKIKGPLF